MTTKVERKTMNKEERTEARRLLKRRFELLRMQLAHREQEVAEAIRREITAEYDEKIKKHTEEMETVFDEARELQGRFDRMARDANGDGLQVVGRLELYGSSSYERRIVVANLESKVRERLVQVRTAGSAGKLSLHEQELHLEEQLMLAALTSEAAQEFIGQIPTVDALFPLPQGIEVKEIEQTNGGE